MKKSQEGLYTNQTECNFYLEQWEVMRSRSEVIQGPENPVMTYSNNEMVGLSTDCRALTRATCGIAIEGDQQSLIADLILDIGITRAKNIAGVIQRKEAYLKTWVDTYNLYRDKCRQPNDIKKMLKDRLQKSWDSWPSKVWKMTEEGVQLVKEHIDMTRVDRSTGILKSFWNTFRRKTSGGTVKQEQPDDSEMISHPESFTGDLPLNSVVGFECSNRPDQLQFINAINEAKQSHDDDQITMTCKCPGAFEWKLNHGWDAEERLQQQIHLEESKDPHLWDGPLGQRLEGMQADLEKGWSYKQRKKTFTDYIETNKGDLSEKENMLFRWMCIHVILGGTSTTNPKPGNVFDYIHHSINYTADFVLDSIEGTGLTGLYSVCDYKVHDPALDTWTDEDLSYIWEQFPIQRSLYTRAAGDHQKFMKAMVGCVAVMMHEYQLYHIDIPTALALSPEKWRIWCMQWHMFKRDYEIARAHLLIPDPDCRYEAVCIYLETLMRLEVVETEVGEGGVRQKSIQVCPSPYTCPYCNSKYKNYTSVANAATAIWQHCSTCAQDHLKISDAGPTMPAFKMKIRDTISIMEAKMTATGGLDFEPNFEVIFGGLLQEALEQCLPAFQDLVTYHKVSQKASKDKKGGKPFGINVCLWQLIANGQIFNQRYLHPWYSLEQFQQESEQCYALLDEWVKDANATTPWGTLIIRKSVDDFPANTFSFSPNNKFGPARPISHPHLHPTRYQSWAKDVIIHVPAKGPLPMGSFCGADGYGLIHPNTISAAVLQCCIASSQESPNHFKFDAMALAPNMDLLMSCKDAERVAQTIAQWNCGKTRTDKLELIKPPGSNMPKDVGTPDWNVHVRSEVG